jgi:hypothetical protein
MPSFTAAWMQGVVRGPISSSGRQISTLTDRGALRLVRGRSDRL